ncbi:MAG TPA: Dabb family protein [Opitutaceae bacterium]|nr:Dabb family protein [Opitutaceae bacterium]
MLIHTVFFWLKPELTDAQRAEFRRGVESLAAIKHVDAVYVGVPAAVPDRPVADKTFAVGLTVTCRDVAAHNAYQADPIHLAFIARFQPYWTRVQVYDAQ